MSKPGLPTYIRDVLIFGAGLGIVVQQTGFPALVDTPAHPSIPALVVGALFCNGPVVLQALALRFGGGTSGPGPLPPSSRSESPSQPSAEPFSGGN